MGRGEGSRWQRARAHLYNTYYARVYKRLNRCPTCKFYLKTVTGYCSDRCEIEAQTPAAR